MMHYALLLQVPSEKVSTDPQKNNSKDSLSVGETGAVRIIRKQQWYHILPLRNYSKHSAETSGLDACEPAKHGILNL